MSEPLIEKNPIILAIMQKQKPLPYSLMSLKLDENSKAQAYNKALIECAEIVQKAPTIDAVPIKFIDEVIEYLTKCRDYAIHEETKTAWDEQRQTLIMLLHEWAAWNECGRTGKYGERRANDEAD